jgi:MtrB/PioB family decaheme-associated outer membrane protein
MKTHCPPLLLATLLSAGTALAAPDTAEWKCTSCPYPKGVSGSVEIGLGVVSDDSAKFGDMTGLQRGGTHLLLDGQLHQRGTSGYYADIYADQLGLDVRRIEAQSGREGAYSLRLGLTELPRHYASDATSPFIGSGSANLTLPAGFPAAGTSTMPLDGNLNPVALGLQNKRYDIVGSVVAFDNWTYRLSLRRDTREGTRPSTGSFFANAAQLALPVDQVTDQIELAAAYTTRSLQASVAYQLSRFNNNLQSLTWANPFWPVVPGADRGQLALAPDNQAQQITGSVGYQIMPALRASADVSVGRLTQDAAYLAATLNPSLAVAALPAQSLDGLVETFNSNVKLTATPLDQLRITAAYARDVRDNRTTVRSYPLIAGDAFLGAEQRSNTPFSLKQDRFKLSGDYGGFKAAKLSAGLEQDNRERPYTEVVTTRETTAWARVTMQPREDLALHLKLAHSERENPNYGVATWFGSPENPLLRKYNLAARNRDSAGLRADWTVSESVEFGFTADYAEDHYGSSLVGLTHARDWNVGVDLSAPLGANGRVSLFAQTQEIRSRQAGSQTAGAPDWTANNNDQFNVMGLSVKHRLMDDKLELAGDISRSRSTGQVQVASASIGAPFPNAKTGLDSARVQATYKLQADLSLIASYWHERYSAQDWRVDGVLPATVQNLLSFGSQSPNYALDVVRLSVRYRF